MSRRELVVVLLVLKGAHLSTEGTLRVKWGWESSELVCSSPPPPATLTASSFSLVVRALAVLD